MATQRGQRDPLPPTDSGGGWWEGGSGRGVSVHSCVQAGAEGRSHWVFVSGQGIGDAGREFTHRLAVTLERYVRGIEWPRFADAVE